VFEYVGCGLPVLTLGHRTLVRLLDEEGIGLSLPDLDGLAQRLDELDLTALRRQVAKARSHLTVEANIGKIDRLYTEVVSSTP
jgi:glycosyltransferase involved in cell wall biosynthesis